MIKDKSALARLLATENIMVQHRTGVETAWFDIENRILVLPVWIDMSNDLNDMLIVHEVGHALETPSDKWMAALDQLSEEFYPKDPKSIWRKVKGFLNVIEDIRIDKLQKERYPGSKKNYIKGYKELIERDFFNLEGKNVNDLLLIDRMNIHFKGGSSMFIRFSENERKFIEEADGLKTFDDVVNLVRKVYTYCKSEINTKAVDIEYSDPIYDPEMEMELELEFDYDDKENDKNNPEENEYSDEDLFPASETEAAWEENKKELLKDVNYEVRYVPIPKLKNIHNVVDDYKKVLEEQKICLEGSGNSPDWYKAAKQEMISFRTSMNSSIAYMIKEFELKKAAKEYQRTTISSTGVLETNRLHSYKFSEDLFKKITEVEEGTNHGFVIFLDWSGSMRNNLLSTIKQLMQITLFCRKIGVPFEVYTFRNDDTVLINDPWIIHDGPSLLDARRNNDHGCFKIRNIISSRMNNRDFYVALEYLWYQGKGRLFSCDKMTGTPLNEAIITAYDIVPEFKNKTKIQIVNVIFLTDGDGSNMNYIHDHGQDTYKVYDNYLFDDVLKKNFRLDRRRYGQFDITNTLLQILKERTNCNLLGFYLMDYFNFKNNMRYSSDYQRKQFREEGFTLCENSSYDEYYYTNVELFDVTEKELDLTKSKTNQSMAKNFKNTINIRNKGKQLLKRFVAKIAIAD